MDRTRHCRGNSRPVDVRRARGGNNRARRDCGAGVLLPAALRAGALLLLAGLPAGCSLSFPIEGIAADTAPTGSIDRTAAVLPPGLDREDLRRARAALAVALDPQGNGARVGWQNPQSGAHGAFAASAPPFADRDRVCRRFGGDITPAAGGEHRLSGSACRENDGSWQVRSDAHASS